MANRHKSRAKKRDVAQSKRAAIAHKRTVLGPRQEDALAQARALKLAKTKTPGLQTVPVAAKQTPGKTEQPQRRVVRPVREERKPLEKTRCKARPSNRRESKNGAGRSRRFVNWC